MSKKQRMLKEQPNCYICGFRMINTARERSRGKVRRKLIATFDHIIPKSFGGLAVYENLKLAHAKCNESRGNTDITPSLKSQCYEQVVSIIKQLPEPEQKSFLVSPLPEKLLHPIALDAI